MFRSNRIPALALTALMLAAASSSNAIAGAVPSYQSGVHQVDAYSTSTFQVFFAAGQRGRVGINGDDDTDLDLEVYNAAGDLVVRSNGMSDSEVVAWDARGGWYTIIVTNLGPVYNVFSIWTN